MVFDSIVSCTVTNYLEVLAVELKTATKFSYWYIKKKKKFAFLENIISMWHLVLKQKLSFKSFEAFFIID